MEFFLLYSIYYGLKGAVHAITRVVPFSPLWHVHSDKVMTQMLDKPLNCSSSSTGSTTLGGFWPPLNCYTDVILMKLKYFGITATIRTYIQ
jgi:hypothetical protein